MFEICKIHKCKREIKTGEKCHRSLRDQEWKGNWYTIVFGLRVVQDKSVNVYNEIYMNVQRVDNH